MRLAFFHAVSLSEKFTFKMFQNDKYGDFFELIVLCSIFLIKVLQLAGADNYHR